MTLEEAIVDLGNIKVCRIPVGELQELKALNLGIEALELIDDWRNGQELNIMSPLPGETED